MLREECNRCIVYKTKCEEAEKDSLIKFYCGVASKEIYSNSYNVDCMNGEIKDTLEYEEEKDGNLY